MELNENKTAPELSDEVKSSFEKADLVEINVAALEAAVQVVTTDIAAAKGVLANVSPKKLARASKALNNLLSNPDKYFPVGGEVEEVDNETFSKSILKLKSETCEEDSIMEDLKSHPSAVGAKQDPVPTPELWNNWKSSFRTAVPVDPIDSVMGPLHFIHNPSFVGRFFMPLDERGWLHASENGCIVKCRSFEKVVTNTTLVKVAKKLGSFVIEVFDIDQKPLLLGLCYVFNEVSLCNADHPADMMTPTRAITEALSRGEGTVLPLAVTTKEKAALVKTAADLNGRVEWVSSGPIMPVFRYTGATMDDDGKATKAIANRMRKLCARPPTARVVKEPKAKVEVEAVKKGPSALEMFLQGELWVDVVEGDE